MNPLGWSFGWTLAVSTGVVLAAITIAVVNSVADAPTECDRCGSLVPPDEQGDHDEMHARLDAAYAAAAGKFVGAGEPRTAPAPTTSEAGEADTAGSPGLRRSEPASAPAPSSPVRRHLRDFATPGCPVVEPFRDICERAFGPDPTPRAATDRARELAS